MVAAGLGVVEVVQAQVSLADLFGSVVEGVGGRYGGGDGDGHIGG